MSRMSAWRIWAQVVAAAWLVAGCGGGGELVADQVLKADGDAQTAMVGTELAKALSVRVVSLSGEPVAGQVVNFRVTGGGGSVLSGTAATDSSGYAGERWLLGTVSGSQRLEVSAVNSAGMTLVATFSALAVPGLPATMQLVSGDQQLAERGGPLSDPIVVIVADRYGNPIPGIEIAFAAQNGGKASLASAPTDAAGQAATTWTLGASEGDQFLRVDLLPLPSIKVHARATPSSPYAVAIASGNLQTIVQHTLPGEALAVKVTDFLGDPLPGVQVEFYSSPGSGYIDNPEPFSTTDAVGLAVWQRGAIHSAGQQRISAKISANASLLAEFVLNVIPAGSPFEGGFAIGLESPIVDDGQLRTAFTFRNGVLQPANPPSPHGFTYGSINTTTGAASMVESLPDFRSQYYSGTFVIQPDGAVTGTGTWLVGSIDGGPTSRGTWWARKIHD